MNRHSAATRKEGAGMSDNNRKARPLNQQELESAKQALLAQKRDLWRQVADIIKKDASEAYQDLLQTISRDPGDKALAELRESTMYSYVELKAEELQSIEEALQRIEAGEYGRCRDCNTWIQPARLSIMPYAVRCRDCQSSWETVRQ